LREYTATPHLSIGAVFVVVDYLLTGSALFFELTEFHPLVENFVETYTNTSLAGGGPERASETLNAELTEIHQWRCCG
jgi:hypothetical protein